MEPIHIPVSDTLDLHTFLPNEIGNLLQDYLSCCREKGIYSIRLIHGKGMGVLKRQVITHLKKNPLVLTFKDAPPESGGWGATLVTLVKKGY
jgi:DNA-nicking Smr family endonuclease